jgi:putative ABC transport system ATP-binding protein
MLSVMHPSLRFEQVTVGGDEGRPLLDAVSVDLELEGVTAVLGPSGAGKSTLLRLCNRLEVPTAGRVLLDGEDLARIDPLVLRRRVGMVFQQPATFAGTVLDNLRVARSELTAADLAGPSSVLARVGLDPGLADRRADDLSGGEAQRMCMARTLLTEPEVVLMDEPTSSLDPANRQLVEALTRDLASSGIGVLWVTHDLAQARRLAAEIVVLVDGRLASEAEAAAFVETDEPEAPDDRASRRTGDEPDG